MLFGDSEENLRRKDKQEKIVRKTCAGGVVDSPVCPLQQEQSEMLGGKTVTLKLSP